VVVDHKLEENRGLGKQDALSRGGTGEAGGYYTTLQNL